MRTGSILAVTAGVVVALSLGNPGRAAAGVETLEHGIKTVCLSPLEFIVSPYVAGDTLHQNMNVQGYSPQAKALFAGPGFIWLWANQIGMAGGRIMSGLLELPLGIAVLPFKWQPRPLLDADTEPALFTSSRYPSLKFGIYFAKRE